MEYSEEDGVQSEGNTGESAQWTYIDESGQNVTVSGEDFDEMLNSGLLPPGTQVYREGDEEWQTLPLDGGEADHSESSDEWASPAKTIYSRPAPESDTPLWKNPAVIVVLVVVVIAAAVIPSQLKKRTEGHRIQCFLNLSQFDESKQQWALDSRKAGDAVPGMNDIVGPSLYLKGMPKCPAGGVYTLGAVLEPTRCSLGDSHNHVRPSPEEERRIIDAINRGETPAH